MARRRRLLERFRPMAAPAGALGRLAHQVDGEVEKLTHDVRLFAEARDRGLLDARLVLQAREAYGRQLSQATVFDGHLARWVKEPLTPEGRNEVTRLVGKVSRFRSLGATLFDILARPAQAKPIQPPSRQLAVRVPDVQAPDIQLIVCDAIARRLLLQFTYRDSGVRVVAPHAHGANRLEHEVMRAWQVEGVSRSGESVGWRLFLLSQVKNVTVLACSFQIQAEFGTEDPDLPTLHCKVRMD